MAIKRGIRILGFIILNLGLVMSKNLYYYFMDDSCSDCVTLYKSENKEQARKKKTLINSFKIIKSEFQQTDIEHNFKNIYFWNEKIKGIKRDGSIVFEDTLFFWPKSTDSYEYKFKLSDENKFIEIKENFGYWDLDINLKDTFTVGVFKREKIVKGKFVYIKQSDFKRNCN